MSNIKFSPQAWEDYHFWLNNDKQIFKRIDDLIKACSRDGAGIGKPERLSGDFSGWSSCRITKEHRMIYKKDNATDTLFILQLRHHYKK